MTEKTTDLPARGKNWKSGRSASAVLAHDSETCACLRCRRKRARAERLKREERAAELAIGTERERCAAIVQKAADTWWVDFSPDAGDLRAMVREIDNERSKR